MKKISIKSTTKRDSSSASKKEASDLIDIGALILRDHEPIKELISILKDPDQTIWKERPAFSELELTLVSHAKAEEEKELLAQVKKNFSAIKQSEFRVKPRVGFFANS